MFYQGLNKTHDIKLPVIFSISLVSVTICLKPKDASLASWDAQHLQDLLQPQQF